MKDNNYFEELEKDGYYETIDKRSKDYREYKEWLSFKALQSKVEEDNKPVGLGDIVAKITEVTGIKKLVEAITDDCGCDERKEKFNKIPVWSRRKVRCIEPDDYTWLKDILDSKTTKFTFEDRGRVTDIYNHVFRTKVRNTKCSPCIKGYLESLQDYLDIYDN
jgi:hypothetical protein